MINVQLFSLGVLIMTLMMVTAKRISPLLSGFRAQSFLLFLSILFHALATGKVQLYIVALLLFAVKVLAIPYFLRRVAGKINVDENVGFFINPTLSLFIAAGLVYLSYLFAGRLIPAHDSARTGALTISLAVMLIGFFIMVFRMKALTQIVGLLTMENGLFLAAAAVSDGIPFFVEIAIFFDIFVCVIIMGVFVYKINRVFTHINVNKLSELKG